MTRSTPFALVLRRAGSLEFALDHWPITRIESPPGLVVGHLGPNRETQDGAQLGRKEGSSSLEITVEDADATHLDCQGQPNMIQGQPNMIVVL